MYERFTERARRVMQFANQEAQRLNHEYIGTEHILLGLLRQEDGPAIDLLRKMDVDPRKIRFEIERMVQPGPGMVTMGRLPQTPRAKKVLELSIDEARNLGFKQVDAEHILLGLLRETDGVAYLALYVFDLKLESLRGVITREKSLAESGTCAYEHHFGGNPDRSDERFSAILQSVLRLALGIPLDQEIDNIKVVARKKVEIKEEA